MESNLLNDFNTPLLTATSISFHKILFNYTFILNDTGGERNEVSNSKVMQHQTSTALFFY